MLAQLLRKSATQLLLLLLPLLLLLQSLQYPLPSLSPPGGNTSGVRVLAMVSLRSEI